MYLRTDPQVVHRRILERDRTEEKTVPLTYIETLHGIHEDWLHHQTSRHPVPAPVLEIDANAGLSDMIRQIQLLEPTILNRRDRPMRSAATE